jgi:hypothetical protein
LRPTAKTLLSTLILAFAPVAATAACTAGAQPAYEDISAVYFTADGVTEPVTIASDQPQVPGKCPVSVGLYATRAFFDMGAGPMCFVTAKGAVTRCCGATRSDTDDSPGTIFTRLITILKQDSFYSVISPAPTVQSNVKAAGYTIAVMRCGAKARREGDMGYTADFFQPDPNERKLTIRIPFGSSPQSNFDSNIVKLFADVARAIYASDWHVTDVY